MTPHPLARDLDHILAQTTGLWPELRHARIFITGGTGFIGTWLLESLLWANDRLNLDVQALVLTRDPAAFARKAPHLARHPALRWHTGDVRNFAFPAETFTHLIHAATPVSAVNAAKIDLLETIAEGTRHVLALARRSGAKDVLYLSSGAVYAPNTASSLSEGASVDLPADASPYARGKRLAEEICVAHHEPLHIRIARGFAFVGPHLPLDGHLAIGNFIGDALAGRPIQVRGDGSAVRSYLYAADLAIWLWTILLRGTPGRAYNVGSPHPIVLADLAHLVADTLRPGTPVHIAQAPLPGVAGHRYVPNTDRARSELGLAPTIDLVDAITRTAAWHRAPTGPR